VVDDSLCRVMSIDAVSPRSGEGGVVLRRSPSLAKVKPTRTIVRKHGLLYASEMDFSQPFRVLTPTLDGPVIRVLARTTHPMTRQQVTELIGDASEAGVRKVLRRLADQGMVIEQRIGGRYIYVGNREHILWPAVEVLMSAADRLDAAIREHVEAWGIQALSVELFGSVAAGTSTAGSDVDLMVYRPSLDDDQVALWDSQVAELRMAVERWTGNACEILEIDPLTLVEMAAEDEPVLKAPRVPISGLNIARAFPRVDIARSIQKAMAGNDVGRSLSHIDLSSLGDGVTSPELRRTMEELLKVIASQRP
jgi:predicted nucleotidyltransferase